MHLLKLAASLWQHTHLITPTDLQKIRQLRIQNVEDWLQVISNYKLKEYLQRQKDWHLRAQRELELLTKCSISYVIYGDENYPPIFYQLSQPPLFLTYQGDLSLCESASLSVVGSREPSLDAITWLESYFYRLLRQDSLTVVSGAAKGIDQIAHQVALFCQRPTIAIFPSGLGSIYPLSFMTQAKKVLDGGGLLLSEYGFQQAMLKHHFYQRNRLIAVLGKLLFVVEARRKSGSLITAKYAIELGRDILVLPSSPFEKNKMGSLDLLLDGAFPVRDEQDLAGYLSPYLTKAQNGNKDKNKIGDPEP